MSDRLCPNEGETTAPVVGSTIDALPLFTEWENIDPHRPAVEERDTPSSILFSHVPSDSRASRDGKEKGAVEKPRVAESKRDSPGEARGLGDEDRIPWVTGRSSEYSIQANGEESAVRGPADEIPLAGVGMGEGPYDTQDWARVAMMRAAASTRLSNRLGAERVDRDSQINLGKAIIADLVNEEVASALNAGLAPWDKRYQAWISQAVFDALFRLGRLQPLVDDEQIENIIINGADNVWLEYANGRVVRGRPVAESDEELVDFLCFIASRSQSNARSFSEAEPRLHLRLDSGARLAAAAWVTPRPSVVVRRHRMIDVTLDALVARKTLSAPAARFLSEMVRNKASIVVSGAQGAGKTTLMRALCAEIDPSEIIGTFETEYELHLHEMPDRHRTVFAWEARPGSGERDAQGRRAGEFLIDEALYDSFRFNLSRQIVGEVRGKEIMAMIKAMQSGSGSLSTTHANSAEGAIRKLITCAMEAGSHVTAAYATRAIAADINVIVHMSMETEARDNDSFIRRRWVSEILALSPSDSPQGYATTRVFSTLPGDHVAYLDTIPEQYEQYIDPVEHWGQSWV